MGYSTCSCKGLDYDMRPITQFFYCQMPIATHTSPTPDEDPDPAPDIPDRDRAGPSISCSSMGCESSCEQGPRGIRCTCHPGFLLGRDGRSCVDVAAVMNNWSVW